MSEWWNDPVDPNVQPGKPAGPDPQAKPPAQPPAAGGDDWWNDAITPAQPEKPPVAPAAQQPPAQPPKEPATPPAAKPPAAQAAPPPAAQQPQAKTPEPVKQAAQPVVQVAERLPLKYASDLSPEIRTASAETKASFAYHSGQVLLSLEQNGLKMKPYAYQMFGGSRNIISFQLPFNSPGAERTAAAGSLQVFLEGHGIECKPAKIGQAKNPTSHNADPIDYVEVDLKNPADYERASKLINELMAEKNLGLAPEVEANAKKSPRPFFIMTPEEQKQFRVDMQSGKIAETLKNAPLEPPAPKQAQPAATPEPQEKPPVAREEPPAVKKPAVKAPVADAGQPTAAKPAQPNKLEPRPATNLPDRSLPTSEADIIPKVKTLSASEKASYAYHSSQALLELRQNGLEIKPYAYQMFEGRRNLVSFQLPLNTPGDVHMAVMNDLDTFLQAHGIECGQGKMGREMGVTAHNMEPIDYVEIDLKNPADYERASKLINELMNERKTGLAPEAEARAKKTPRPFSVMTPEEFNQFYKEMQSGGYDEVISSAKERAAAPKAAAPEPQAKSPAAQEEPPAVKKPAVKAAVEAPPEKAQPAAAQEGLVPGVGGLAKKLLSDRLANNGVTRADNGDLIVRGSPGEMKLLAAGLRSDAKPVMQPDGTAVLRVEGAAAERAYTMLPKESVPLAAAAAQKPAAAAQPVAAPEGMVPGTSGIVKDKLTKGIADNSVTRAGNGDLVVTGKPGEMQFLATALKMDAKPVMQPDGTAVLRIDAANAEKVYSMIPKESVPLAAAAAAPAAPAKLNAAVDNAIQPKGEDRVLVDRVSLNEQQANEFLRSSTKELVKATAGHQKTGSTFTGAVVTTEGKIVTAHLGDTPAVAIIHDPVTNKVQLVRLTEDHKPVDGKGVQKRVGVAEGGVPIIESEGKVWRVYVNEQGTLAKDSVATNRGLGNAEFGPGISNEPDIETHSLPNTDGKKVFLLVASDGVFDHDNANMEAQTRAVQELLERNPNATPADVTKALTENARALGSKDDLTAAVVEVEKGKGAVVALFDGHGPRDQRTGAAPEGVDGAATAEVAVKRMQQLVDSENKARGRATEQPAQAQAAEPVKAAAPRRNVAQVLSDEHANGNLYQKGDKARIAIDLSDPKGRARYNELVKALKEEGVNVKVSSASGKLEGPVELVVDASQARKALNLAPEAALPESLEAARTNANIKDFTPGADTPGARAAREQANRKNGPQNNFAGPEVDIEAEVLKAMAEAPPKSRLGAALGGADPVMAEQGNYVALKEQLKPSQIDKRSGARNILESFDLATDAKSLKSLGEGAAEIRLNKNNPAHATEISRLIAANEALGSESPLKISFEGDNVTFKMRTNETTANAGELHTERAVQLHELHKLAGNKVPDLDGAAQQLVKEHIGFQLFESIDAQLAKGTFDPNAKLSPEVAKAMPEQKAYFDLAKQLHEEKHGNNNPQEVEKIQAEMAKMKTANGENYAKALETHQAKVARQHLTHERLTTASLVTNTIGLTQGMQSISRIREDTSLSETERNFSLALAGLHTASAGTGIVVDLHMLRSPNSSLGGGFGVATGVLGMASSTNEFVHAYNHDNTEGMVVSGANFTASTLGTAGGLAGLAGWGTTATVLGGASAGIAAPIAVYGMYKQGEAWGNFTEAHMEGLGNGDIIHPSLSRSYLDIPGLEPGRNEYAHIPGVTHLLKVEGKSGLYTYEGGGIIDLDEVKDLGELRRIVGETAQDMSSFVGDTQGIAELRTQYSAIPPVEYIIMPVVDKATGRDIGKENQDMLNQVAAARELEKTASAARKEINGWDLPKGARGYGDRVEEYQRIQAQLEGKDFSYQKAQLEKVRTAQRLMMNNDIEGMQGLLGLKDGTPEMEEFRKHMADANGINDYFIKQVAKQNIAEGEAMLAALPEDKRKELYERNKEFVAATGLQDKPYIAWLNLSISDQERNMKRAVFTPQAVQEEAQKELAQNTEALTKMQKANGKARDLVDAVRPLADKPLADAPLRRPDGSYLRDDKGQMATIATVEKQYAEGIDREEKMLADMRKQAETDKDKDLQARIVLQENGISHLKLQLEDFRHQDLSDKITQVQRIEQQYREQTRLLAATVDRMEERAGPLSEEQAKQIDALTKRAEEVSTSFASATPSDDFVANKREEVKRLQELRKVTTEGAALMESFASVRGEDRIKQQSGAIQQLMASQEKSLGVKAAMPERTSAYDWSFSRFESAQKALKAAPQDANALRRMADVTTELDTQRTGYMQAQLSLIAKASDLATDQIGALRATVGKMENDNSNTGVTLPEGDETQVAKSAMEKAKELFASLPPPGDDASLDERIAYEESKILMLASEREYLDMRNAELQASRGNLDLPNYPQSIDNTSSVTVDEDLNAIIMPPPFALTLDRDAPPPVAAPHAQDENGKYTYTYDEIAKANNYLRERQSQFDSTTLLGMATAYEPPTRDEQARLTETGRRYADSVHALDGNADPAPEEKQRVLKANLDYLVVQQQVLAAREERRNERQEVALFPQDVEQRLDNAALDKDQKLDLLARIEVQQALAKGVPIVNEADALNARREELAKQYANQDIPNEVIAQEMAALRQSERAGSKKKSALRSDALVAEIQQRVEAAEEARDNKNQPETQGRETKAENFMIPQLTGLLDNDAIKNALTSIRDKIENSGVTMHEHENKESLLLVSGPKVIKPSSPTPT